MLQRKRLPEVLFELLLLFEEEKKEPRFWELPVPTLPVGVSLEW